MLKLTRNKHERIIITHEQSGEKVVIEILDVTRNWQVRLGISADKTFLIDREEIHEAKKMGTKNDDTRNDRIQRDSD